jgi:cytochrome c-type biogenesis protein CcmH/NrfG
MVKKETLYIVALITFGVGFLSGVIYAAFTAPPVPAGFNQAAAPAADQPPQQEDMLAAIKTLEEVVAKEPGNYEAWVRLGNNYFDTDQPDKAIAAYDTALAIHNGSPDVWTDLGIMYRRTGRFDQAIESFDQAAQRDPSHAMSRFNKGIVLLHDFNDPAGAVAAWQEVLAIDPTITLKDGRRLSDWVAELQATAADGGAR